MGDVDVFASNRSLVGPLISLFNRAVVLSCRQMAGCCFVFIWFVRLIELDEVHAQLLGLLHPRSGGQMLRCIVSATDGLCVRY